jgi:hypothetical protein
MTVKGMAAERPTLVSIAVPHAERLLVGIDVDVRVAGLAAAVSRGDCD